MPTPSPTAAAEAGLPYRDLLDLARRFNGYDGPDVARTEPFNHAVGDHAEFTLLDLDNLAEYTVSATVRAVSEHAYFFVQDGEYYPQSGLDAAVRDFEEVVWPTITGAFGEPRTPGVDGDPRITILHADLRGAGGYVTSSDQWPRAAVPGSNEREMLYIEAGALAASGLPYNALVAHELQHLVLQNFDDSEESWVNEGQSEVAWEMVGGSADGVWEFLGRPDYQLNHWPASGSSINYAASELFMGYVLDHYGGRENASALCRVPEDGVEGIDVYLRRFGKTFEEVFADFAVANLLDAPDGPYSHPNFDGRVSDIGEIAAGESAEETVAQFGADYLRAGPGTFTFDGADEVSIGIPQLDGPFWWSDRADVANPRLTFGLDLTDTEAATLEFDAWFDIERGWDYGYVSVSLDGGSHWTALAGEQTTDYDPLNVAYGPGYSGRSRGWVRERIDLTPYAGRDIDVRFEMVYDDSTNQTGFAIDNVTVPEIGLVLGDESREWKAEGWRQVEGPLEQRFVVQVVTEDGSVTRPALEAGNRLTLTIEAPLTIVISATTPKTTERASYAWRLD